MKQLRITTGVITLSLALLLLAACASEPEDFGSPEATENALVGQLYLLPKSTRQLPDFTRLEPTGTLYTTSLDIASRNFEEGFPEVSNRIEWFGLQYEGVLRIDTAGVYTFALNSDDGSRLRIGSQLVVDNDFQHSEHTVSGQIRLAAGEYPLTLEYFQGPKYEIALQFFITPPGQVRQIFDSTVTY